MADASGYTAAVAKRVRPRVEELPWPRDKRLVRAKHTLRQLRALLAELEKGAGSPVHDRALAAAEAAAATLWGSDLEQRVEAAARALTVGALYLERSEVHGVDVSKSLAAELDSQKRLGELPARVDLATWRHAVKLWADSRAKRRGGGGKWAALGAVFNRDPDSLKRLARKARDLRKG